MSICRGIPEIQCGYRQSATVGHENFNVSRMLTEMLHRVEINWESSPQNSAGKRPSKENWRLDRRLFISPHNESPEKTLEKAIARFDAWYNQIPTASGLYDHNSDKHRNIDLVHQITDSMFQFVELKVGSNTPVEAMMELLTYAVLYVFARKNYTEEEQKGKKLLRAEKIAWMVLAPRLYYGNEKSYGFLANRVTSGLKTLLRASNIDCQMEFGFWSFPIEFSWRCSDQKLKSSLNELVRLN